MALGLESRHSAILLYTWICKHSDIVSLVLELKYIFQSLGMVDVVGVVQSYILRLLEDAGPGMKVGKGLI